MFFTMEPGQADEEAEWLDQLKAGDSAAFDRIYDRYRNRLYGFLLRMSGRSDVAEDLLQETWLRLASRAGSLNPGTLPGPWLFTVARNLFYSYCRNRAMDENRIHELSLLEGTRVHSRSPVEIAAMQEFTLRLECAISRLRPAYWEALLLVGVEGMTPSEAAAVCGLHPEALRKRLSRAREMLGVLLESASAGAKSENER